MELIKVRMNRLKENHGPKTQSKMGVLAVDRRKHARFAVDLPLSYSRVDDKELFGGIVANASGGGILVYLPERMEIGAVLKIEIFYLKGLEIGSIETIAKVVWSDMANGGMQSEHRYGLEFQYIEQKDYSRLVALLKESGN